MPAQPAPLAGLRPPLGHGVGLRTRHFADWLAAPPKLGFVEAVSENFFAPGGRPIDVLLQVRRDVPVALHGVSLSIGSVDPLSATYLSRLGALVRRVEPAVVSDHLCWGSHGGRYAHDLWPLPQTEEAVEHVAARVRAVQDALGRRILLENVSTYAAFRDQELTEWDFVAEVARRADCGILLDVNNVVVSARNHGFDPLDYLAGLPGERIGQLHLAGHQDRGAYLFDSHDHPVPEVVWELYREVVRRFGPVPAIVEWDERIPPLDEVVAESRAAAAVEAEVLDLLALRAAAGGAP
ncbi:MAG TPA: DUF692 domain-containing protein [Anaeromyxobacteraceae bacterium]|nr:DUF692 domain-containing protein [Anaeromyxobacteraceae bacterium]